MEQVPVVHHFRQIVLWPLELMPIRADAQIQTHWRFLHQPEPGAPWRPVEDEFTGDPQLFQERHYSEFVTFLPYVQRFLYGEGRGMAAGDSPIRVFRSTDVARARLTFPDGGDPVELEVAHVDLYFFYDIDVVILAVELAGEQLPLPRVQEALYRLGRAYPTTRTARSSSRTSAATARPRSRRTGSSCSRRWSRTTRASSGRCGTGRSSITACRSSGTWRSAMSGRSPARSSCASAF